MPSPARTLQPVRAYGLGSVPLRGGFLPYGSTTTTGKPTIPATTRNSASGPVPRWGGFSVLHDPNIVGRYNISYDSDWMDFWVIPEIQVNLKWYAPTVFLPSTTLGSGIQLTGVQAGPGALATIPVNQILTATGGSAGSASAAYVVATGVLTITSGSTATNTVVAAAINAWASYTGTPPTAQPLVATVVGTGSDVFYTTAVLNLQLSGGDIGVDQGYASWFMPSTTSGYGIMFTANQPGPAGNALNIIFVAGGAGSAASVALTNPALITLTVDTSATNQTICTAINVTAIATVGALITASVVNTLSATHAHWVAAGTDVYNALTAYNTVFGTFLTGGGLFEVKTSGPIQPHAISISNDDGVTFNHFNLSVYKGGTPTDCSARAQAFIPSATVGSGVVYNTLATTTTQASKLILSTTGGTDGVTWTAVQPGDIGNLYGVVYAGPTATGFLPSVTSPDGVTYTSQIAGVAGNAISIAQSAPAGSALVINVIGTTIYIQPQASTTNAQIVTAIGASPNAAALVSAASTGTSDTPALSAQTIMLGGGYSLAAGTANVQFVQNGQSSSNGVQAWNAIVTFGSACTNAEVCSAVPAGSPMTAVYSSSSTDHVIATGLTLLAGGSDPADQQVVYAGPLTTTVATAATIAGGGTIATLTVASTTGFPSVGTIDVVDTSGAVQTLAYTGTTATTFTTLSGGTAAHILALGAIVNADAVTAQVSGNICTVNLGYTTTNNTNSEVAAAVNGVSSAIQASPWGTLTDTNQISNQYGQLPPVGTIQLLQGDQILFTIMARDDASASTP